MKLRLSKLIPVRMTSRYRFRMGYWPANALQGGGFPERATWWQWRGRVWAHHRRADFAQWRDAPEERAQ